ncbi:zinc finger CCCH domain-containing protein 19-like [Cryptomeria japonica]|uniref:zinc finger CCCH domain-containing protein 19-like n=1 Tax=Cryptomeria japonica TaxID=3369 RepID=UPI0027DA4806|nr:zinc finger CCCH domain-containing protein 19-like [Cryptomeria japonica]
MIHMSEHLPILNTFPSSTFKEYVKKIKLLSNPEERARILQELPKVIAGPCLQQDSDIENLEENPENCSQANWEKAPKSSENIRNEQKGNDPGWSCSNWESDQNNVSDQDNNCKIVEKEWSAEDHSKMEVNRMKVASQPFGKSTPFSSSSRGPQERIHDMQKPSSSTPHISKKHPSWSKAGNNETDKVWRYRDRVGKVRGPFTIAQLRKWQKTGLLPLNLRIWKIFEHEDDSILLTDALAGRFYLFEESNDYSARFSVKVRRMESKDLSLWLDNIATTFPD